MYRQTLEIQFPSPLVAKFNCPEHFGKLFSRTTALYNEKKLFGLTR